MRRLCCERMLGKLARWLRLLGEDAPLLDKPCLSLGQGEVLLTRRLSLQGRPGVLFIEHDRLEDQLRHVLSELKLTPDSGRFFRRCLDCNVPVEPLAREQAEGLVPDFTLETAESFTQCPNCKKIFWPGSHGERARDRIIKMLAPNGQG